MVKVKVLLDEKGALEYYIYGAYLYFRFVAAIGKRRKRLTDY
jgi:hypothetical protein